MILEELILKECVFCNDTEGKKELGAIDTAIAEIRELIPKEKPRMGVTPRKDSEGKIQFIEQEYQNMGFNAAIAEIKERLV